MRMARNIYKRNDGRFEARYANGFDSNGKQSTVLYLTTPMLRSKKTAIVFLAPKSITSMREISLPNSLLQILLKWRQSAKQVWSISAVV